MSSSIPKKCPFCKGYLYLDENARCCSCSAEYHNIHLRYKCSSDVEYDIKCWYNQRRIYFGWEHPLTLKWELERKQWKEKAKMNKLKKRLDAWYRLNKRKRIVSQELNIKGWKCDICKRVSENSPQGLEFSFDSLPQPKSCFGWLLICYECKRYVNRLIKEKNISELFEVLSKKYNKNR